MNDLPCSGSDVLPPGWTTATSSSGEPEPVLTSEQWRVLDEGEQC